MGLGLRVAGLYDLLTYVVIPSGFYGVLAGVSRDPNTQNYGIYRKVSGPIEDIFHKEEGFGLLLEGHRALFSLFNEIGPLEEG